MQKQKRRPMHYHVHSLCDGTVLIALPVRKPTPKAIKRDHIRIDDEGVCAEWPLASQELSHARDEAKFRFLDIVANRMNTRRAIRELVLPELAMLREEIAALRSQLDGLSQHFGEPHSR